MSSKEGEIKAEAEQYKVEVTGERGKKEATIYTHYGTVPVSERRDHKVCSFRKPLPAGFLPLSTSFLCNRYFFLCFPASLLVCLRV